MRYFTGSYTHKVDAKGRVSLPAAYRNTLKELDSEQIVLIPQYYSRDFHVGLSERAHEAAISAIERNQDLPVEQRRAMLRPLVSDAVLLMPDDAGRIVLPREIRDALGMKGEARFVAMGSYFELWNFTRWSEVNDASAGADIPRADFMGVL